MDLTAIAQSVWRYKLATIPVILLTLVAVVYTGVLKPGVYEADASYILIAPPPAPSALQIAKNPALGRINTNDSYLRFGDLSIVVDLLSQSLTADATRQQLVKEGADPRFTVAPSTNFGGVAPIIQISGIGSSAASAMRSAQLVSTATVNTLYKLQSVQGTNPTYMISTLNVTTPHHAQLQISGKLRSVVALMAIGMIILFIVVSTMTGLEERRTRRWQLDSWEEPEETPLMFPQPQLPIGAQPRGGADPAAAPEPAVDPEPELASYGDRPAADAVPEAEYPDDQAEFENGSASRARGERAVSAFAWRR